VLAHHDPIQGEELLPVRWFSLDEAKALDLPSITRFVLKEVEARLAGEAVQPPFLRWSRGAHSLERLTS
jgi:8-oxo-dGTP pyrophosphatase MutT (NUDIX family)